jgi:hypothetical protein
MGFEERVALGLLVLVAIYAHWKYDGRLFARYENLMKAIADGTGATQYRLAEIERSVDLVTEELRLLRERADAAPLNLVGRGTG